MPLGDFNTIIDYNHLLVFGRSLHQTVEGILRTYVTMRGYVSTTKAFLKSNQIGRKAFLFVQNWGAKTYGMHWSNQDISMDT